MTIHPITKASQTGRNQLKAGKRVQKAVEKAEKQQTAKVERGKVGARLRMMILERDHGKCVLCGAGPTPKASLVVDHILPIAQGGKSREENLATLCQPCNAGKGARIVDILRAIGHNLKPAADNPAGAAS